MKKKKKKAKRPPRRRRAVTLQQERFIDEYLVDLNGTRAAIRAGYGERGAHTRATELLKKPRIRAMVDRAVQERAEKTKITAERVLEELYFLMTSNVDDYEGGDGRTPIRVRPGVDRRYMRAVSSVKKRIAMGIEGGPRLESVEFRLWDKPKAVVTAMRRLGMLNDKLTVSLEDELQKAIGNAGADFERGIARIAARVGKG